MPSRLTSVEFVSKLTLIKIRQSTPGDRNKEMKQSEVDKPCHVTRKFRDQFREDFIFCLPLENAKQAVTNCTI